LDLRGKLSPAQTDRACAVLDYQPFIIADDIQTGAAYSWTIGYSAASSLVFRRHEHGAEEWDNFTHCAEMQRRMYDTFLRAIAARYRGGTFLDVACNNGYFPVGAELVGMRETWGIDLGAHYARAIGFLNEVFGTQATFSQGRYDPLEPLAIGRKFDVVCASAISCHLPDPLNFLAWLGTLANEAIFFFDQVVDTDELLISYTTPRATFGSIGSFPYRFNEHTRMSRGLLYHGFQEMGFSNIVEIPWEHEWLTAGITAQHRRPEDLPPQHLIKWQLGAELIGGGSRHRAVLACR
jgi:hypothetical protein